MKGRPRKPTARHELEGTARADRMNADEPRYPVEAPPKPAHIKARKLASAKWDDVVPIMLEQRTLSPAYATALELFCLSYANGIEYEEKARKARDFDRHRTYRKLAENAQKEHRQWVSQLGLSAATSGKVSSAPPSKDESPLAKLRAAKAARAKIHRIK